MADTTNGTPFAHSSIGISLGDAIAGLLEEIGDALYVIALDFYHTVVDGTACSTMLFEFRQ
jgi:hypothetical protein